MEKQKFRPFYWISQDGNISRWLWQYFMKTKQHVTLEHSRVS